MKLTDAYQDGYAAHWLLKQSWTACPYVAFTEEAKDWHGGYLQSEIDSNFPCDIEVK